MGVLKGHRGPTTVPRMASSQGECIRFVLIFRWTLWSFVGFEDGSSDSYTANTIAECIFFQVDEDKVPKMVVEAMFLDRDKSYRILCLPICLC